MPTGNWSVHNHYHADGNGNVTYLVNSSQTLAASYRYDPYGNLISSSGTLASANVYRFSSKEIHVNSGLYYYGYRWYHPNLQRWLNRDPIGENGGINLYRYAKNDVANNFDENGLKPRYHVEPGNSTCNPVPSVYIPPSVPPSPGQPLTSEPAFCTGAFLLGGTHAKAGPVNLEGVGFFGYNAEYGWNCGVLGGPATPPWRVNATPGYEGNWKQKGGFGHETISLFDISVGRYGAGGFVTGEGDTGVFFYFQRGRVFGGVGFDIDPLGW